MNKQQHMIDYINKEFGITISKTLASFILNPSRIKTLNNKALKEIVIEYAPIYNRARWILDGPSEMHKIAYFSLSLICRITNKPKLQAIMGILEEQ